MPEVTVDFEGKRKGALERLCLCYRTEVLGRSAGRPSPATPWAETWITTVEVEVGGEIKEVKLEVNIPFDFPLSLPRPYLLPADRIRFGPLPHVDAHGFICTFDPTEVHVNVDRPGDIVIACVARAARLLEASLNGISSADFEDEFLAYWGLAYSKGDRIDNKWLSLIDEPSTDAVTHLSLTRAIGPYTNVIHAGGVNRDRFVQTLESLSIEYTEQDAFYLPSVPLDTPPFALTNGEAIGIVQQLGAEKAFARYVNTCNASPTVVFSKTIAGRQVILGWRHQPPTTLRNGFRKGALTPYQVLNTFERGRNVTRLNPDRYTPDRILYRTGGADSRCRPAPFVVGLGSIGSHLVHHLGGGFTSRLGLLDPQTLQSENVGRHLLGLAAVGQNKASAIRNYVLERDPFLPVEIVEGLRLGEALHANPEVFSCYNRLIVAIGDTATELWLGGELAAGRIKVPTVFLWVEPYLAGGHCVYIRPGEARLANAFDEGLYRWNVIPPEEYRQRSFAKRETGCQTSFVPYAGAQVIRFVAAVCPHVLGALEDDRAPSFRLTWTGDLAAIESLGIALSEQARAHGSFALNMGAIDG